MAVLVPAARQLVAAGGTMPATLVVNGQTDPSPVSALTQGGTWYVAADGLLQSLGLRVEPSTGSPEVSAAGMGMRLGFTPGSTTVYLDGTALSLDSAPLRQGGTVFVPVALAGLLGAQTTWDAANLTLTVADTSLEPVASIAATAGGVELMAGDGGALTASAGETLAPGDHIVTGSDGSAQVQISDGSIIDVAPNSNLQLTGMGTGATPGSRDASFTLVVGRILARIFDLGGGASQLQISTPTAVVGDRGTTFLIEVTPSGATTAAVLSGQITLAGRGGESTPVTVGADQESVVAGGGQPASPASAVGGMTVGAWLAHAVADAAVTRAAQSLPPQAAPASQQALLQKAAPAIEQALNELAGQPFSGNVTTTGGAGADLASATASAHVGPVGAGGQGSTGQGAGNAGNGGVSGSSSNGNTGSGSGSTGNGNAGNGNTGSGNTGSGNTGNSGGSAGSTAASTWTSPNGNLAGAAGTQTPNGGGNGAGSGSTGTTVNGSNGTTGNGSGATGNGSSGTTGTGSGATGNGSATTGNGSGTTGNGSGTTGNGSGTTGSTGTGSGSTGNGTSGTTGNGSNGTTGTGSGSGTTGNGSSGTGAGTSGQPAAKTAATGGRP